MLPYIRVVTTGHRFNDVQNVVQERCNRCKTKVICGRYMATLTPRTALFGTVADRDYLQFWQSGRFQPKRVVRFLALSKAELAALAAVAPSSVRFDEKIPRVVRDLLIELAATSELVAQFFDGNLAKTAVWFATTNPVLGDIAPQQMIRSGGHVGLRRFVMEAFADTEGANAPAEFNSEDK